VQVVDLDCDGSLLVHADATLGSLADPAAQQQQQQQQQPPRSLQSIEVLPLNAHHTANRCLWYRPSVCRLATLCCQKSMLTPGHGTLCASVSFPGE